MQKWQDLRDLAVRLKATPGPKTHGQVPYFRALREKTITLAIGPPGSGKTYIAVVVALELLAAGKIEKIVLTRPLVTCGKGVGFLPGDVFEKVSPFLRPLLDTFKDFVSEHDLTLKLNSNTIEVWPLDLMRGMSLKKTMLICDEAQNAEYDQLKMLLTRFGEGSKVVVAGDATQSDIGGGSLIQVMDRLRGHRDIATVFLTRADIVRHPLIKFIDQRLSGEPVIESWYSVICPSCNSWLHYDNGDENDLTVPDVEQVRCWSCKTVLDLPEFDDESPAVAAKENFPAETYPQKP